MSTSLEGIAESSLTAALSMYLFSRNAHLGTIFSTMQKDGRTVTAPVDIEPCGMVTYDRRHNPIPWDSLGASWGELPPLCGLLGVHWPNFLHADPAQNLEAVAAAEAYFRRAAAAFGTILSRGIEFYASQELYKRYARTEECGGAFSVDLSALPSLPAIGDRFYISAKKEVLSCEGGECTLYERAGDFATYEVVPKQTKLTLRT